MEVRAHGVAGDGARGVWELIERIKVKCYLILKMLSELLRHKMMVAVKIRSLINQTRKMCVRVDERMNEMSEENLLNFWRIVCIRFPIANDSLSTYIWNLWKCDRLSWIYGIPTTLYIPNNAIKIDSSAIFRNNLSFCF